MREGQIWPVCDNNAHLGSVATRTQKNNSLTRTIPDVPAFPTCRSNVRLKHWFKFALKGGYFSMSLPEQNFHKQLFASQIRKHFVGVRGGGGSWAFLNVSQSCLRGTRAGDPNPTSRKQVRYMQSLTTTNICVSGTTIYCFVCVCVCVCVRACVRVSPCACSTVRSFPGKVDCL